MIYATPENACKALPKDVEKKIVVAKRGECFFDAKAWYAMEAGAVALIVVNNDPQETLMIMAPSSKGVDNIKIPVVMVSLASEPILRNAVDNGNKISIEYQTFFEREEEYPRVEGTQYEMIVFGQSGWGIKLNLIFSETTAESSWTIQIQDREMKSSESTPESGIEALSNENFHEALLQLKEIGFLKGELDIFEDENGLHIQKEAPLEALRDVGLNDVAYQLSHHSSFLIKETVVEDADLTNSQKPSNENNENDDNEVELDYDVNT